MSQKPQSSTTSDAIQQGTSFTDTEMAKEKDLLAPEEGGSSKKGRGLLQVPSRSSSQKNQSSPTSTGLSGATVSDPRNSIGGRSKDSKGSFLSRQRNGSASSNRTGGETEPSHPAANSQANSPVAPTQKKKKSGGLLALFGCCVAPNSASTAEPDNDNENVHKLDKLPPRPATAKSRTATPQEQPKTTEEKAPQEPSAAIPEPKDKDKETRVEAGSASDEITSTERETQESKQAVPPAVTVQPPQSQSPDDEQQREASKPIESGDVDMQDAPTEEAEEPSVAPAAEETTEDTIPPPPPPGPSPAPIDPVSDDVGPSAPEPQKWLLPPIAPEHKGRKCLVLDLDETLVHSSFKVGFGAGVSA